jgi:hypothetical protein
MCGSSNMCNGKVSTNMGIVKLVICVWCILELTWFLFKKQGPVRYQ